ncbi:hypothetical protein G9P44_003412 [Scheffersomyces stipitis]|nr:hypothetical protein G9P44_003412 [Scheffersomyces stipitis]
MPPYELVSVLQEEVHSSLTLHPQIATLNQLFLKCLKEPRYQSPLTINELSKLFNSFYRDLNALVINIYTQSNSTKKQLIAASTYFNNNPKVFDYLLAIANYSTSSIKLLKRSDPDALYQLRIFNYYKFLMVFESIEASHINLLSSINVGEDISLYDKLLRFDNKDIIYQEFLADKIVALKGLDLSFKSFIDTSVSDQDKIISFIENLTPEDLAPIQQNLTDLNTINVTPYSKLQNIVQMHKNLIKLFLNNDFKNSDINNDLLLPSFIYLIIYKLQTKDLFLNFVYIKNFANLFDPYKVEVYPVNLNSSYYPTVEKNYTSNKYRICNLYEMLNLNESSNQSQEQEHVSSEEYKFFDNDRDLIHHLAQTYMNSGELHYYLTNFEAIIVFLSNITISELLNNNEIEEEHDLHQEQLNDNSNKYNNKLLLASIFKLVDEEILAQFQFPDGKLAEEAKAQEEQDKQNRSRSSSLVNTISNRINETRSRSNSSIMNTLQKSNILAKEKFPTLSAATEGDDTDVTGFSMMKNILGRIGSVGSASVQQLRYPTDEHHQITHQDQESDEVSLASSNQKRSSTLFTKLSPNHSRTRSSSLENAMGNNGFLNAHSTSNKRNSITAKLTNGVSEFMTKLNTTQNPSQLQSSINKNISNSSLHSLEGGETESTATLQRRSDITRSRTTSLQVMDKWFNNIGSSYAQQQRTPLSTNNEGDTDLTVQLTRFHHVDFDNLSVKDLRELKGYYDQMCELLATHQVNSNGRADKAESKNSERMGSRNGSVDGIFKSNNGKLNDKSNDEISNESSSL